MEYIISIGTATMPAHDLRDCDHARSTLEIDLLAFNSKAFLRSEVPAAILM
jgi:hypothetical protein